MDESDQRAAVRRAVQFLACDAERCGGLEHAHIALVVAQLGLDADEASRVWGEIRALGLLVPEPEVSNKERSSPPAARPAAGRPIDLLLHQTRGHSLLTQNEEAELSRTARLARSVRERPQNEDDSDDCGSEEQELQRAGSRARERLILANVGLVLWWARRRAQRDELLEDAVQRGMIGLIRAADGFDPELGFRFSTYASQSVERQLLRSLRGGRGLRLPESRRKPLRRIHRCRRRLFQRLEREPTPTELADASGESISDINLLLATEREWISVDRPVNPESPRSAPRDTVADLAGSDPFEQMCLKEEFALLAKRLNELDERARLIVTRRFGLGGAEAMTLQELGDLLGLTRERVRQIESAALRRLARAFGVEPSPKNRREGNSSVDDAAKELEQSNEVAEVEDEAIVVADTDEASELQEVRQ